MLVDQHSCPLFLRDFTVPFLHPRFGLSPARPHATEWIHGAWGGGLCGANGGAKPTQNGDSMGLTHQNLDFHHEKWGSGQLSFGGFGSRQEGDLIKKWTLIVPQMKDLPVKFSHLESVQYIQEYGYQHSPMETPSCTCWPRWDPPGHRARPCPKEVVP